MELSKKQDGFSAVEVVIVAAVIGILGFGAWRVIDMRSDKNDSAASSLKLTADLTGIKSMDEIVSLAAEDIDELQVMSVKLEQKDADLFYFIKLSDGTVLAYDAKTGTKVQVTASADDAEDENDDDDALPAGYKPAVSLQAAIQAAQSKRPGKTVSKISLELEDGVAVYSVRFSDKGRVDVDAATAEVLRVKEPGQQEVKLRDDDGDIDDDKNKNSTDTDDDNDGTSDREDEDDEGDGVDDDEDEDDDNDGVDDNEDEDEGDDDNSGSNSGSGN